MQRSESKVPTRNASDIDRELVAARKELETLDSKRDALLKRIDKLSRDRASLESQESTPLAEAGEMGITSQSSEQEKTSVFRLLFRGREDVYARRFESMKTGQSGYYPASRRGWDQSSHTRPKSGGQEPEERELLPLTDQVIRSHLVGRDLQGQSKREFTVGIYPLLPDEACWFLAVDFDKGTWGEDVSAFLEICRAHNLSASVERSRSGNGAHVWFFFSEPIASGLARQLGSALLTETMERRPEVGLDSYDRLFPGQDTMPKGGFGNLIALPLQNRPRADGNTVFLDDAFVPHPDQWAFLSTIRRLHPQEVESVIRDAGRGAGVYGTMMAVPEDPDLQPWLLPPSRRKEEPPVPGPLPKRMRLVLGNQIYIPKSNLPASLRNRLIRLAAFQNPEFYKAQAMRLSTYGKPRIISCCEDFPGHIGLPRGCYEELIDLLQSLKIEPEVVDERFPGNALTARFRGTLRPEQREAADALLRHDTGVLSATTAFGKTVVAAYLIAERGVNALVLVHRRQLMDQWMAHLRNFLELDPKDVGQIGGGKRRPTGVIDVAMIQSLSRKGIVDDILGEYGHVVVDECHHISARSFEIVARQSKARFVTGLSATVTRRDGHHPIIFMQCGPVRHRVDERSQAAARPFSHNVLVRKTGFVLPETLVNESSPSIHEIYAALIADEARNSMIITDVLAAARANRSPIVLTERRKHLSLLHGLLEPLVRNLVLMRGGMGRKQRRLLAERLASIPNNEERVILATGRYLGKGFDDKRLDTLFLALPVSWRGTLTQYAGRLHRLHDTKREVIIYDYADLEVPMLSRMFERRSRGYRSIGYQIGE